MPIDKATGEKICINGCGLLQQAKTGQTDFLSHFIPSVARHKEVGTIVDMGFGYALEIWVCPECRYIELYDFELGEV